MRHQMTKLNREKVTYGTYVFWTKYSHCLQIRC